MKFDDNVNDGDVANVAASSLEAVKMKRERKMIIIEFRKFSDSIATMVENRL